MEDPSTLIDYEDGYEEGMYAPVLDGIDPSIRYKIRSHYIRVGNIVQIDFHIEPIPSDE